MSMDEDTHTPAQREGILMGILQSGGEHISDYARFKSLPADERDRLGFERWLAIKRRQQRPQVRDVQPGESFTLLRTGERYTLLHRENKTPSGTRYAVKLDGQDKETSLHPSCLVRRRTGEQQNDHHHQIDRLG